MVEQLLVNGDGSECGGCNVAQVTPSTEIRECAVWLRLMTEPKTDGKRADGLTHKSCEERADGLTHKICEERVDGLTLKIDGVRVQRLTHNISEERADGLTQRLVDDDGSESGGCR